MTVGPNVPVVVSGGEPQRRWDAHLRHRRLGDLQDLLLFVRAAFRQREPDRQRHQLHQRRRGSSITFASSATLSGGTNSFNLPIFVPYTLVPSLAGNSSFDQVYIEAGTISSGTLSLNLIGNNPQHELCVPDSLHSGRWRNDGGRCERAGPGGVDAERRGGR